jgi:hypothetical protein
MSSRACSGSLPRPWITRTKPEASGSPVRSTVTSLLSFKAASPVTVWRSRPTIGPVPVGRCCVRPPALGGSLGRA